MNFQKYYNEYVGLSPLKKEELIDELFKELFQNVSSKGGLRC